MGALEKVHSLWVHLCEGYPQLGMAICGYANLYCRNCVITFWDMYEIAPTIKNSQTLEIRIIRNLRCEAGSKLYPQIEWAKLWVCSKIDKLVGAEKTQGVPTKQEG